MDYMSMSIHNMICLSIVLSLVIVDAKPLGEKAPLPESIFKLFNKNQNKLLVDSIIGKNYLKELLSKHNMPNPDTDTTFHEELKKKIMYYLNWYFIRVQLPAIVPHVDVFVKREVSKMKNPPTDKQCARSVLDQFIEFLQAGLDNSNYLKGTNDLKEMKETDNLKELIDFINENPIFSNDLTKALLKRLELEQFLDGKPVGEQNFYLELFNGINAEEKWFSETVIDHFFKLSNILLAKIVYMKVEVDSFFIGMN